MKVQLTTTLIGSLFLAACGGGGGAVSPPQNPVTTLAISPANAQAVSLASYDAAFGSGDLADLGGSIGLSATAPGQSAKPPSSIATTGFFGNIMQKVPFGPDEFPCAVSGNIVISGDIANPVTLTPGDNFLVVSTACDDGLGEVVDGSLSFTVAAFEGDVLSGAYAITMDTIVDNLQVTSQQQTNTADGDVRVSLDNRSAPLVTASVSGSSMTTDSNSASETLTNYSTDQTLDAGPALPLYTLVSSGTLETTQLAGSVSYSTPVRFEGIGNDFPNRGELLINGDGSSARLIAVDNVNVRIEVDSDGDGTVDETINTTWLELTT